MVIAILIMFAIPALLTNDQNVEFDFISNPLSSQPQIENTILIEGFGEFKYDPNKIETVRSGIFQKNHFSVFDILVFLKENGNISMKYYFNESLNTHVIKEINGKENWWYNAHYDGGWSETNVFRMDHFPYKDEMSITLFRSSESKLRTIYEIYENETKRKDQNNGKVIIPEVIIQGTDGDLIFEDVEVTVHNLRNDIFQNGTITAIDVIMSLGDHEKIAYELKWYDSIGTADIVRSYWVDGINDDIAYDKCGFVYESGSNKYKGFSGNHIHIPSDTRVINNPEYVKYFWICL